MSLGHPYWCGRRKRAARRIARDARQLAPLIALACCFAGSATAILVAHRVPDPFAAPTAQVLPAVSAPVATARVVAGEPMAEREAAASGCPTTAAEAY